ncbi:hypothetical protein PPS11_39518 [Pseudomonas putida S11]|nr:hypothetical protein PPS11_39518 [Pseudomonas putida S11]
MHRAVITQRNRLNSDAWASHNALVHPVKKTRDKVVVFFQGANLLADGLQGRLQGRISAARLAYRLVGP